MLNYRVHPQQLSLKKRKDQILCALAAKVAATLRREGIHDPLYEAKEITPALLAEMGISEEMRKKSLLDSYLEYIHHMFDVGGYSAVPEALTEMLEACHEVPTGSAPGR